MPDLSLADRAILLAANVCAALRHPWLALSFWWRRRRVPAFATPRGYAELVQWRKIFDRNPLFPVLVDKLAVKRWAVETVPGTRTAEVLWAGTDPAEIPAHLLAPGHVVKANHGTRFNYFPGAEPLPRPELEARLAGWIARPFRREVQWAYGEVERRLFVERQVGQGAPLWEFTYRCSGGRAISAFVASGQRGAGEANGYFAPDGTRLPLVHVGSKAPLPDSYVPPPAFHAGRHLAERLSRDLDHVRVDLMWDGETLYLCEMTLYPGSGFGDEERTGLAPRLERGWLAAIERSWFLSHPQPVPFSLYAAAARRWFALRRAEVERG